MKNLWEWAKAHPDRLMMYMWVALALPTVLWWKDSILWIAILSLYANFETSRAADKADREESLK